MNKIDLIINEIDGFLNSTGPIDYHPLTKALAAARELRALEPVAWVSESPTRGNGKRLFFTENEAYHYASKYEPLYALGESND